MSCASIDPWNAPDPTQPVHVTGQGVSCPVTTVALHIPSSALEPGSVGFLPNGGPPVANTNGEGCVTTGVNVPRDSAFPGGGPWRSGGGPRRLECGCKCDACEAPCGGQHGHTSSFAT